MRVLLLILCSVIACQGNDIIKEWSDFKVKFKKKYDDPFEELLRMKIFCKNRAVIEIHNKKYEKGKVSFELGMNQYGDQSQQEFEKNMLGKEDPTSNDRSYREVDERMCSEEVLNGTKDFQTNTTDDTTTQTTTSTNVDWTLNRLRRSQESENSVESNDSFTKIVTFLWMLLRIDNPVDWEEKGALTTPRDQGHCGSCWAFSATGALEAHVFIKTGKLVELSVQNLVDCTRGRPFDNLGCQGGNIEDSLQYINENGGVATEDQYPYEMKDGKCRYDKSMANATCLGYRYVRGTGFMKKVLETIGPASVVLDASTIEFRFYKRGIYKSNQCSDRELNHAVVLVGYGQSDGIGFWKLKNSWGTTWGEGGYFRIDRRTPCGVDNYAIYPLL